MILKAGTYTFNPIPYFDKNYKGNIYQEFQYTAHYDNEYSEECSYMEIGFYETEEYAPDEFRPRIDTDIETPFDFSEGWVFSVPFKFTTTIEQDVSNEFFAFVVSSTDYFNINGTPYNVAGWRKLKSNYADSVMWTSPQNAIQYPYISNLSFSIEEYNGIKKLSCIFAIPVSAPTFWLESIMGVKTDNSEFGYVETENEFTQLIEMLTTTPFKVLSTDNSTVDYWLSEYTEAVEEPPLATIEYNGETIAQLNAGETATLSCEGKKMASDIVVKVNEVESKIPEGYVKPEGTLNILRNNTTYDVSQYAEVRIATAHPYEVPLEMLMNNVISDASQATIGNVYKYTGETTDTYEQGALYILEEVSE